MNFFFLTIGTRAFIGPHLTEYCVQKRFKVFAFNIYNSNYSLGNLEKSKYK
jgi:hypothetical protein